MFSSDGKNVCIGLRQARLKIGTATKAEWGLSADGWQQLFVLDPGRLVSFVLTPPLNGHDLPYHFLSIAIIGQDSCGSHHVLHDIYAILVPLSGTGTVSRNPGFSNTIYEHSTRVEEG